MHQLIIILTISIIITSLSPFELAVKEFQEELSSVRAGHDKTHTQINSILPVINDLVSARKTTKKVVAKSRWVSALKSITDNKLLKLSEKMNENAIMKVDSKDDSIALENTNVTGKWDWLINSSMKKGSNKHKNHNSSKTHQDDTSYHDKQNSKHSNDKTCHYDHSSSSRHHHLSKRHPLFARKMRRSHCERNKQKSDKVYDFEVENEQSLTLPMINNMKNMKTVKKNQSPDYGGNDYSLKKKQLTSTSSCPTLPSIKNDRKQQT